MITDLFLGSSRRLHRDKEDNNGRAKKFILERSSFRFPPLFFHPRLLLLYVFLFLSPYIALVTGCSNKFARHLWRGGTRPRFAISKIGGEFSGGKKKCSPRKFESRGRETDYFRGSGCGNRIIPERRANVVQFVVSSFNNRLYIVYRIVGCAVDRIDGRIDGREGERNAFD